MKLQVVSDNILVELVDSSKERVTNSGLYMPSTTVEGNVVKGIARAVGPGKEGSYCRIRVGDTVWFPKAFSTEFNYEGNKYYVISELNITAYFQDTDGLPF